MADSQDTLLGPLSSPPPTDKERRSGGGEELLPFSSIPASSRVFFVTLCARGSFADDAVSGTTKLLRKWRKRKEGVGESYGRAKWFVGQTSYRKEENRMTEEERVFSIRAGESENDIRVCRGPRRKGKEGHHKRGTKKVFRANSLFLVLPPPFLLLL